MSLGNSKCRLGFGPFTLGSTEYWAFTYSDLPSSDTRSPDFVLFEIWTSEIFSFPLFLLTHHRGSSTAIMTDFLIWIQKPPQPLPHFPSRTMYEGLHSSTATHINPTVLKLWLCHPYWFFGRFIWRRAYINARKRGNCTSSPVLRGREKKGYPPHPCPLLLIKWPDVPGCNRKCLLLNWSWDLPSLFPPPRWSSKSPWVIKKCLR